MKQILFHIIIGLAGILPAKIYGQESRCILVQSETGKYPLSNVELTVDFRPEGPYLSGKTDSTGKYCFSQSGAFKLVVFSPSDTLHGYENTYTGLDKSVSVKLMYNDLNINPVTITGTMGPRAVSKNPYIVRVITRDKIDRMGAQNLSDVLQNETNVQLGQDAVLGTSAIMQGIGGQDIKILINGIPVIGRINGNVDISQIPVSNIERIEIIEGPMSTVYGTDALGGVINIITKNPGNSPFNAKLNTYHDNLRNYNYDVNLTTRINKKMPVMINAGRNFFTGRDFDPNTRSYDWKPKTKYFGDVSLFYNEKNSTHRFSSNYYSEKLTDRSNAEFNMSTITGYNSYYYTTRFDNTMHNVFKLNKHNKFELQNAFNYYTRTKNTIKRNLVTGDEKPYRPEDQDTTGFTLFNSRGVYSHYNPGESINWIAGYDFNQEHGTGKRIPVNSAGIRDIAAFGSMEYSPSKNWEMRPSLRIIYNDRFGSPVFKGFFGDRIKLAPFIPSLQVKYNMSEHLAFRGSYSKGFRAPSLKELNFYFVDVNHNIHGNDSLRAETSDNFILSFDYRHRLPMGKGVVFGFSLYNNSIKNKINLALVEAQSNLYTYINIGRFRSQGLNVNFEYFTPKFTYTFSGSFLSVFDLLQQQDTFNQKYYINGQVSFNVRYKLPAKGLSVSMFSRYTSPTNGYTENSQRYRISGYYLMDVTVQKTFKKVPLNINIGCKNLLGVTTVNSTRNASSNPHSQEGFNVNITPGRTLFLQLSYIFDSKR